MSTVGGTIRLNEKFAPLFEGGFLYYGFYGGRGSGKSHGVAQYAITAAVNGFERIFTARQFKNSTDISSKILYENKIRALGLEALFDIKDKYIECKTTGTVMQFLGLDRNPDSIRSLEGATLTIFEEAQTLSQYAIQTAGDTVMREKNSRMVFVWNPINAHDPVDRMLRGKNPPALSYVSKINYTDNEYFDKTNLVYQMEHLRKTNLNLYRHVWEGEYFGGGEKRVFQNVEIGIIPRENLSNPQYGLDFGSSRDPNAAVRLYVNERDKWIYIEKTFRAPGDTDMVLAGLSDLVHDQHSQVICDSAWPQSIAVIKKSYPSAYGAKKGANSVVDGIKWLQSFKIYIHPDCKDMIEEAQLYSWQSDKYRTNEDGSPLLLPYPEDTNNHLWDAVRYATEQNRLKPRQFKIHRIRF